MQAKLDTKHNIAAYCTDSKSNFDIDLIKIFCLLLFAAASFKFHQ